MTSTVETERGRRRGRPRDPELEQRVLEAALDLYAERGWSGFTLDGVARRAQVGAGSLYRRFETKEDLLIRAVNAALPELEPFDTGTTHGDLVALGRHFLTAYAAPYGVVGLRMVLDARNHPGLAQGFASMLSGSLAAAALEVVDRAQGRGDLPPDATGELVLYVLTGATLSRVLFRAAPGSAASEERFLERLASLLTTTEDLTDLL